MTGNIETAASMLFIAILFHGCASNINIHVDKELVKPSSAYCAGYDLGKKLKETVVK